MIHEKELFRDPQRGKIAGVCAGLAEYFGWELWLVRIITLTGFLLSGSFFLVAYIAAWFILDSKPGSDGKNFKRKVVTKGHRPIKPIIDHPVEVKAKVWQAGEPPKQAFHDISQKFAELERKLRTMETFVTSPEFTVKREINRL